MSIEDLIYRLKKRAEIRRQIVDRKSVQEGKPDRIADILEEAAQALEKRESEQARQWVGLTDEEQTRLFTDWDEDKGWGPFIEAVEAKLKEKNT